MPAPMREIAAILRERDDFLILSHENPDGDAVGSTAALGHILAHLGKRFTLANASPVPPQFAWMDIPGTWTRTPGRDYGFALALDCGDLERLGPLSDVIDPTRLCVIDHHLDNPHFGSVNWVDTVYSSTGEMVAALADELDVPLTGGLGRCLYVAMVTDTGDFTYGSTRPETLELAARLLRAGLDVGATNARLKNQWTISRIRLWSEVMGGMRLFFDGAAGSVRISQDMLRRTGTSPEDCDGLVNWVLRVRGVRAAVAVRELADGRVKFSLRSVGGDDIQRVAASFGGGGHKNASGGGLPGPLETAEATLIAAVGRSLGL
ncbi:DHH family phosphoesterase [Desulfolutivibrio sulfoxidireducens]|uniref:DHH family phosphoesterase n=1 Tax=Desulfolutivibrio sulfoxidireducens TaxID=2773299 RepID=UPI00159EA361|nr:bifunctional oligoribonuclease/PAP phosphatase NrnA [Desulfolutivibrio sulfoxidireducens]QLA16875.1 bifunctional oligoribonuclease/PAP phosphatase NrnA [Desulfolutivibrio sulfoxidireducens]QLA20441.1 bifunctional oligoribonuclease/PAP phosphatase NrnA [Desulfolutivibrio sulfoxidireducens]